MLVMGGATAEAQDLGINGRPGLGTDPAGPAYTLQDMVDHIAVTHGPTIADQVLDDLTPPDAKIQVGEIFGHDILGAHDSDTILINTRGPHGKIWLSCFEAAMVLYHEYEHCQAARAAGTARDPLTADELCGACEHAFRHYNLTRTIAYVKCPVELGEDPEPVWRSLRANNAVGDRHFENCSSEDCPEGHASAASVRTMAHRAEFQCYYQ